MFQNDKPWQIAGSNQGPVDQSSAGLQPELAKLSYKIDKHDSSRKVIVSIYIHISYHTFLFTSIVVTLTFMYV